MSSIEVSRRYAKAFFAELIQSKKVSEGVSEFREFSRAFFDKEIKDFFQNSSISAEKKTSVVRETLKKTNIGQTTSSFIQLLVENNRTSNFLTIEKILEELVDAEAGITRGTLRSAKVVSKEAKESMERNVSRLLGKKVELTYQEDPRVIAGVVAQVGGWTFDDSVEAHLTKLKDELNKGVN